MTATTRPSWMPRTGTLDINEQLLAQILGLPDNVRVLSFERSHHDPTTWTVFCEEMIP